MTSTALYDRDLARVQHAGFGDFARQASPGLLALLRSGGVRGGTVVDLGCGAGVWLGALVRAGYDAIGIDISPTLIDYARAEAPGAEVRVASIYDVDLPPCDAITGISEVLCYLPPEGRPPTLRSYFKRVAKALRPGGVFICDLMMQDRRQPERQRVGRAEADWAVVSDVRRSRDGRRLTRDITTFVREADGRYRRSDEHHAVRLSRAADVSGWLRDAGFRVRTANAYGRLAMLPGRKAFIARKR